MSLSIGDIRLRPNNSGNSGVPGTGGIPSAKPPQSEVEKLLENAKEQLKSVENALKSCGFNSILPCYEGSNEKQISEIRIWLVDSIKNYAKRQLDIRNVGTDLTFPQLIANNNVLMEIFLNPLISQPAELDKLEESQLRATLLFAARLGNDVLVYKILNDKDDKKILKFCEGFTDYDIENALKLATQKHDNVVKTIINCPRFKDFSKERFCRCYESVVINELFASKEAIKMIKENNEEFKEIELNAMPVENRKFLTYDERKKLIKQNEEEETIAICDPIKAVVLYDEGWSIQKIAESLLLENKYIPLENKCIDKHIIVWEYLIDYAKERKQESEEKSIETPK